MTRWFSLLVLMVAGAAAAQTVALSPFRVRVTGDDANDRRAITASDCGASLGISWNYQATQIPCSAMQLWATDGSCADAPATGDFRFSDVDQNTLLLSRMGSVTLKLADLPNFSSGATACGTTGVTKTYYVCASVTSSASNQCGFNNSVLRASSLALNYDTKGPPKPVVTEVRAADSAVQLSFTTDTDYNNVEAFVQGPNDAAFSSGGTTSASTGFIKVKGLTNGNTYSLYLVAYDAAGNPSEPSETQGATPVKMLGFFAQAQEVGSTERGGCSTTSWLFAPAVLVALIRRRRTS